VSVLLVCVGSSRKLDRTDLGGNINYGDSVFIRRKTYLSIGVPSIVSLIHHTLYIVCVSIAAVASSKRRTYWVCPYINHVEAPAAGTTANSICIARFLVDVDVVRISKVVIMRSF